MLAHSFSVSDPPAKKPNPTVGKKQLMRQTREAALQFLLSHDNEWCLVGTYPLAKTKGMRKRVAYNQAKYYRDRLEEYCAEALAYSADQYPILWDLRFNKTKRQYEVRAICAYRPDWEYDNDIAESNRAAEYEMNGVVSSSYEADMQEAKRLLDETEAELLAIRDRLVDRKQANAVKKAMDSMFFKDIPFPS